MRRGTYSTRRGKSDRGGHRGGQRDGGRDRGGRRRGGGGGPGRGRGARGRTQEAYESGNLRERISVESGFLVLIDQFMLANPQFVSKLMKIIDEDPSAKDELIDEYGGTVIEIEPGTYKIQRDPFECLIVIHPEGVEKEIMDSVSGAEKLSKAIFIDTRCVAMIDRELLDDSSLIEKYQQLWFSGQEKACRDLLRDNGGAVRYGFSSLGDELEVSFLENENVVCLRPEKGAENTQALEEASDSA